MSFGVGAAAAERLPELAERAGDVVRVREEEVREGHPRLRGRERVGEPLRLVDLQRLLVLLDGLGRVALLRSDLGHGAEEVRALASLERAEAGEDGPEE